MLLRGVLCVLTLATAGGHERVPPGVNPELYNRQQQQYQPPPPPPPQHQQYQQHQPQYQQPPQQQYQQPQQVQPPQQQQQFQAPPQQQQQYQQVPQQQQQQFQAPPQQQQQYQQVPQQQQQQQIRQPTHGHHQGEQMLHKASLSGDKEHIKEHLDVPLDTSGMSEAELQFHYFKMHDADSNNMLDGQELLKSLFHWHDPENNDPAKKGHDTPHQHGENKVFTDQELIEMIDPILEQDDKDGNGYIDYTEFMEAQAKTTQGQGQ